jgi:anhydro-N-acetylmuramic acid kinase
LVKHLTYDYPSNVQSRLFEVFNPDLATVSKICQAHFLLGELLAKAAQAVVAEAGLSMDEVDAVASSGQIVYHVRLGQDPGEIWIDDEVIPSALDLGEGTVLAERTGRVCVTNMRSRDMVVGGQGNPLVTYGDWVLFRHPKVTRAIQNIGGIANPTILPAGGDIRGVKAFDTGPGNMLIDGIVARKTEGRLKYDAGGALAARGRVYEPLLDELMQHPYIRRRPPKTAGRELFGAHFIDRVISRATELSLSLEDMVATATALTAESIAYNYREFVFPEHKVDEVLLCGGGSLNKTLVEMLAQHLEPIPIETVEKCGIPVEAREVVCVGIIANETLLGRPGNVPSATGASRPVVMGQVTFGAME